MERIRANTPWVSETSPIYHPPWSPLAAKQKKVNEDSSEVRCRWGTNKTIIKISMACWESLPSLGQRPWPEAGLQGQKRKSMVKLWERKTAVPVQVVRSQALYPLERLISAWTWSQGCRKKKEDGTHGWKNKGKAAQAYCIAHRNRGLCRVWRAFVP